jgi:hypothetical protein
MQGLAAVLPCFVVYLEVGKALKQKGERRWLAWAEADGRGEQANTQQAQQAQQAWRRGRRLRAHAWQAVLAGGLGNLGS